MNLRNINTHRRYVCSSRCERVTSSQRKVWVQCASPTSPAGEEMSVCGCGAQNSLLAELLRVSDVMRAVFSFASSLRTHRGVVAV